MTAATTLAAAAGAIAAVGVTDLARGWSPRRRAPLRRAGAAVLARAGHRLAGRAPRDLAARLEAAGLDTPAGDVMAAKTGAALVALLATLPLATSHRAARGSRRVSRARPPDPPPRTRPLCRDRGGARGRARPPPGRGRRGPLARARARRGGSPPSRARSPPSSTARPHATALGVPLAHALTTFERRAPAPGVAPLVATLNRAARHGAPLGPALAAQAAEARSRAARRHTEAAARAAPQVQLVVALLLVPSVLLLVGAALIPA